jgi:hypothetical protein
VVVRSERVAASSHSSRRGVTSGSQILPPDEEEVHLKHTKSWKETNMVVGRDVAQNKNSCVLARASISLLDWARYFVNEYYKNIHEM